MKRPKTSFVFWIVVTVLLVVGIGLVLITNEMRSYPRRLRLTRTNLAFGRECILLFVDQTGSFPESLHELNDYGNKFPDKINWRFPPREAISSYNPSNLSEHNVLDGTGGLYYNQNTGVLKVNLTKPLKSYWRLYFGKERDEIPADW